MLARHSTAIHLYTIQQVYNMIHDEFAFYKNQAKQGQGFYSWGYGAGSGV